MKPQILIQKFDPTGENSGGALKTQERLRASGAWKRQRIVVIVPTSSTIATKAYLAHWALIFPPNNGVARIPAIEMEVGNAYSTTIEQIINHPELSKWEYILTLEHDNLPPADGVLKLCEDMEKHPKYDVIGGLYFTKGHGGVPQIWGDPRDPVLNFRPQLPDPHGGLVECCGTGMGFNLWRMNIFKDKKLRRPWFVTEKKSGVISQDLYFWCDARKHGYRCAIDCSVRVGHYDLSSDKTW